MKIRHIPASLLALFALSSSADASIIYIYKEIETVTASVSAIGATGDTYGAMQTATGSILSDSNLSLIGADAHFDYVPEGYLGDFGLGSGAGIGEIDGGLEFSNSSGYGECNPLACSVGMARGTVDLTFRPSANSELRVDYYPSGGTVDALLADLTTGTILYQDHVTRYSYGLTFQFGDNHRYRWIASGLALSPPGGDPYGDFRFSFYDTVTNEASQFAPVPEPMSMLLVGTGVAGIVARGRRARRRT